MSARTPWPGPFPLHIELRDGFRGHAVTIALDGREIYRRTGVTSDPTTARADGIDAAAASPMARIAVSAAPGAIAAVLELDVSIHPHVAISLVGTGTVHFETAPRPATAPPGRPRRPE